MSLATCCHVVLVEPEIPSNTGNIARLCAATGSVLHLVHPLGFRMEDAAMKRAGMDYLDLATMVQDPSLEDCLKPAASVYYLTTKSARPYWEARFQPGDYLVFGRETSGLPGELLEQKRDRCLTIPMLNPAARSLNLATAVAIVLYEMIRQGKMTTHPA